MKLTFESMQEYLTNAGYNIAGMDADEIDELAEAEGFEFVDSLNCYLYRAA